MFDWQDLKHFVALARTGSLSAAARELGCDHATVGRRVAALEQALGLRLIVRLPRSTPLTQDGQAIAGLAAEIEAQSQAIARHARSAGATPQAGVRISAPPSIAAHILAPRIAAFNQAFPQIVVTLSGESALAELDRGEADIAVRMVRPQQPELLTQRIGMMRYALYAAPERAAFSPMTITTNSSHISNGCNSCCRGVRWPFRPAICFHCNKRRVQGWVPPFCRRSSPMAIRIWSRCPRPMPRQRASFGW
ncbi:Gcv operon activator [Serratia marcescens]|nr:Gcv operon activator [Serratia marcescens]